MLFRYRRFVPLFCLILFACSAKVSDGQIDLSVTTLTAGQDGRNSAGAYTTELISERDQFSELWNGLAKKGMGRAQADIPAVDFARERVLFLSMGQQPSAGYRIELATDRLTISGQAGIVRVSWQTPRPGGMQAQVMTAPYLLVKLPLIEISEIRVLDQENRLREVVVLH